MPDLCLEKLVGKFPHSDRAPLTSCVVSIHSPQMCSCRTFSSFRFLRSSALKTKYRNIYRPSTGAVMLLAALHTCDKVDSAVLWDK